LAASVIDLLGRRRNAAPRMLYPLDRPGPVSRKVHI